KYNPQGQLITLIEGVDSIQPKKTGYAYNKNGLLENKTKPDGVKLHYKYDSLGRMIEQCASDHSIHYLYTYNALDQVIAIEDAAQATRHEKQYDNLGRLIQETFNHGLSTSYTYDPIGRLTDLRLPDGSSISYTYQGPHLYQVIRKGKNQTYAHI